MTQEREAELQEFQAVLGISFRNPQLLNRALTHTSFVSEQDESRLESNERMEFLGDAVLGMIVAHYLYEQYPDLSEGHMTKIKAAAVSESVLCELAQQLNIGSFLRLGRGEATTGGRQRPSILSDALEALVAAIYLDSGLESAREFVTRLMAGSIADIKEQRQGLDFKSLLQERLQEKSGKGPTYHVVQEIGPDHDKRFVVEARIANVVLGRGYGSSKKEAEQAAAAQGLSTLNSQQD